MWLGLSLFYVGAVLFLNGLWMLGKIADKEIWVINIFTGVVSLCIGLASIFGPAADATSVKNGALTLLFAFTYLWVAFNRFSGADGRGLGWFSLFIAIILSQEFRGRTVARAIFALPIIVSSGVLLAVFKQDLFASSMAQTSDVTIFQSAALEMSMLKLGLDPSLVSQLTGAVSSILDLLWKCGVQILLFIGGIKAVPAHLYEVCSVEGANAWQTFWKVTFPLVTPFILLNAVYSIIDSFTYYSNPVMQRIEEYFNKMYNSSGTTLAVAYCLMVLAVTGLVAWFISRRVFYIEK